MPQKGIKLVILLVLCGVLCTQMAYGEEQLAPFAPASAPPAPDYAQSENWLALPDGNAQGGVDVFWVYPTVLESGDSWLMDIHDKELQRAARWTLTTQASALDKGAKLYAPLYRQMHVAGLRLSTEKKNAIMAYGQEDVWAAFSYYLEHYNKGRSFIIAGHSQGSNLLVSLLIEHWGKTGAEDRLVAGYLIGWPFTPDDLQRNTAISMCASPEQVGCFVSYNTVAAGKQKEAPTILPGSLVVNPLSWKTDGAFVPAAQNKGAVFFSKDGERTIYPEFTSAQIVDGGLVVAPADPSLVQSSNPNFPEGVYHIFDYSLFYMNLRANVQERVAAWHQEH